MPDRVVKTTLLIDEHGAVRAVRNVADESGRTEGKLSRLDTGVRKLGHSFKLLAGVGAVGGIAGLAYGLDRIVSKTGEVATETEKFASLSGFGATASLRYAAALKARGIETEKAAKIFGLLGKNLQSAEQQERKYAEAQIKGHLGKHPKVVTTELGKQAKAFEELFGPKGLGAIKGLPEEGKFQAIVKAFEAMPDGLRKSRIEMQLFGRGGNVLSTVLDKGNLGLTHQLELVRKFYPTLKGGSAGLRELIERQSESRMAWEGFQFTIGTKLIPVFNRLLATFTEIIQKIEKGEGVFGTIKNVVEGVAKAFGMIVGPAHSSEAAIASLMGLMVVSKVAAFSNSLKGLSLSLAGVAKWAVPIAALAATVHYLDKVLPQGERPENLLGGNQPGEKLREGEAGPHGGFKGFLRRWEHGPRAAPSPVGVTGSVHAGAPLHVHVNVDGRQIGEAILKNPQASRLTAEAVTHYGLKRNARQ